MRANNVLGVTWLCLLSVGCANVCEAVSTASAAMTGPDSAGRATFKLFGPPQNPAHPAHVLAYAWNSTSGTIDASHGMDATLTCAANGPVMVSLRITDGVCEQSALLSIDCTVACNVGSSCQTSMPQAGSSAGH